MTECVYTLQITLINKPFVRAENKDVRGAGWAQDHSGFCMSCLIYRWIQAVPDKQVRLHGNHISPCETCAKKCHRAHFRYSLSLLSQVSHVPIVVMSPRGGNRWTASVYSLTEQQQQKNEASIHRPSNYRPISDLPFISEMLQKAVAQQICISQGCRPPLPLWSSVSP